MGETLELAAYDPEWAVVFAVERDRIAGGLGELALRIDHHRSAKQTNHDPEDDMANPSELIDDMIAKTPDWRGTTLAELRRIIHEADPEITEEVKWKRPSNPMGAPVFEHNGIVCIANILKERVRLSFAAGAGLPDPYRLLSAVSEGNKTRVIDVYEGDTVNESALKDLIRAGVERNLAKPHSSHRA